MLFERQTGKCSHLSGFSSTEQKHLDLVFGHDAVLFELALDLVISCDSTESTDFSDCRRKMEKETNWL